MSTEGMHMTVRGNVRFWPCSAHLATVAIRPEVDVRQTFELSGAWKRAKPAVRRPFERGLGPAAKACITREQGFSAIPTMLAPKQS